MASIARGSGVILPNLVVKEVSSKVVRVLASRALPAVAIGVDGGLES